MRRRIPAIWVVLAALCHLNSANAANIADFTDFSSQGGGGNIELPGRLYIPPAASGSKRPLILFLSGSGELGTDNVSQVNGNIDNLLAASKQRGAFLYAPQSAVGWDDQGISDDVITMIARAEATQNVDPNRIYVTGLSLGGGGTWTMLGRYPTEFAAGVPISGVYPDFDFDPNSLLKQSVFAFHARNDVTVPVATTETVANSIINAAHGPVPNYPAPGTSGDYFVSNPDLPSHQALEATIGHVRGITNFSLAGSGLDLAYYEYTLGGHGVFSTAYNTPQMYDWMFSHSLAVPEPSSLAVMPGIVAVLSLWRGGARRCRSRG